MTNASNQFPYYNIVDQIYNAEWAIERLARLALLRQAISALWPNGHPTRLIHVVGTSGKGSTCRFLEMGLSTVGASGALMSPHLFDYRERFSINGEYATAADVTWAWEECVRPFCLHQTMKDARHAHTFQEVTLLIALTLFEKYAVRWAALEASVGGRYDSTRASAAAAVALTNVGGDHAHMLGKEQWQRTLDKAGAARPGAPFFTTERETANQEVIAAVCQHAGAPLYLVDEIAVRDLKTQLADVRGEQPNANALVAAGFQKWNAALSLAVIRHLCPEADEASVVAAMAQARLPGRLWQVEEGIYADVAHNSEKIGVLMGELQARFAGHTKLVVIGLSGNRIPLKVFGALAGVARTIIVTSASFKGQNPHKVREEIAAVVGDTPVLVVDEPQRALAVAKSMRTPDDIILLTGSTYMIEQALNPDPYLRTLNNSYGWRTAVDLEAHGALQLTLPKPQKSH